MTPETPTPSAQPGAHPSDGTALVHVPAPWYGGLAVAGDGAAGPPALSAAPTLTGLAQALRRRWLVGVGLGAFGAAAAVALVFFALPPRYVIEARFNVSAAPEGTLLLPAQQDPHVEFAVFKEYEKALVRSPLVLAAALNEKVSGGGEARELPAVRAQGDGVIDWMERALKADFKVAPEIMSVWMTGDDPETLADLLNAVAAAFVKENEEKESARRRERLRLYRENLKQKEQELSNLRKKLGDRFGPEEGKDRLAKERKLVQAQQDLAACKVFLQSLQGRQSENDLELADLKARAEAAPKASIPADQLDDFLRSSDARTQAILKLLEESDAKLLDYPLRYQGKYLEDELRKEREKRDLLLAKLEQRRKEAQPELDARYRARLKAELAEKIDAGQRRQSYVAAQIKALREQADSFNATIAKLDPTLGSEPPDIQHLKDEIATSQKTVDHIRSTIMLLSVEGSASRVSLQQRASTPTDKDYSRQTKLAGAGGVSMFALMLFGVALWEFRARRISGADEVSQGLGLHVVGALPTVPARAASAPARAMALQNQLQEAIDGVRTMLLHAARNEPLRVIMVTSANGGEGKTSVATQLAASLARAWRKTLLIDGDLRNPAAHRVFDLPQDPGLSEVLRGEVAPEDAIRPAPVGRLSVLPAGQYDSHALEALAQDNVADLFEKLKAQYDFVIVDSCPVLPVADALLLGQHVDGVLFTVLRDVSRAPEVFAAQQRLAPLGIRTLGAVAVGMASDLGSRAYQYGRESAAGSRS